MTRGGWHILREEGAVTVTRRLPVVWDVSAETELPCGDPLRLAQQIRQDLWRALRDLRGFAPAVRVETGAPRRVRAGGAAPMVPPNAAAAIQDVLENPAHRRRWVRWAERGGA